MEKEKKILFVIGGLRAGGAEKVCIGLINEFFRQGYHVSLLVLNLNKQELKKYLNKNVPLYDLNINHARSAFFPLKKTLSELRPDICLSFNFQLSIQLITLKKIFGLKYKIFSRGINTFSKKLKHESNIRHKYINAFLIKKLYKKSDFFIAQSTGMKKDMTESLGIAEEKIKIIFNPCFSFEDKQNEEFVTSINNNKKNILFVGNLKEQKNVSFLLDCIKELSSYRDDFILNIVGGGILKNDLEIKTKRLQIEKFVIFHGFSNRPSDFYERADIFVLSSWYEGFPNVLIEALSYGIPVVSIDCMSGPSDIVENDINGYLVKKYDEIIFAENISKTLDKNWNIEKIKETTKKFNIENIYNQYKEYLLNEK